MALGAVVALGAACSDSAAPADTAPKSLRDRLKTALRERGTSWECTEPLVADLTDDELAVVLTVYEGGAGTSATLTPTVSDVIVDIGDC